MLGSVQAQLPHGCAHALAQSNISETAEMPLKAIKDAADAGNIGLDYQ